ncbi:MAG: hypothetical protein EA417_00235 [Gammaproteobacteria bacterium]|nr:MAG: hypothetical protein EA417_00235 [Gammaproteobacteria bacterium]
MRSRFRITEEQWGALEVSGDARVQAEAEWAALGQFALQPKETSLVQRRLGVGTVLASGEADGELAVVYRSEIPSKTIGEAPTEQGLFLTVNVIGELWLIDGNTEFPVETLEIACTVLIEIGKNLGMRF